MKSTFLNTITILMCFTATSAWAKPEASINTAQLEGEYSNETIYEPQGTFDCSDRIMALIDLKGFERGGETLTVEWIDPRGDIRERVDMSVGININGFGRFYSFIQFHKGAGAGIFAMLNPAMSLEEFIGPWEVKVLFRGRTVGQHDFEVIC